MNHSTSNTPSKWSQHAYNLVFGILLVTNFLAYPYLHDMSGPVSGTALLIMVFGTLSLLAIDGHIRARFGHVVGR